MTYTAIVTPFNDNFSIDYISLEKLLKLQFESSVDGIVALGSTAETITLNEQEQKDLVAFILDYKAQIGSTKKVYIGVSSSATSQVIERIKYYDSLPIDGYLIVTPAYNKPQQRGLVEHFVLCCNSTSKDIILYNVPGRTGINFEPNTYLEIINKVTNNIMIKDANDNSGHIVDLFATLKNTRAIILSGNDDLIPFFNSLGGQGVISVVSNLYPDLTVKAVSGDKEAYFELLPLIKSCFVQTNPVPVKDMLCKSGVITTNQVRLPLVRM
jgi:4-hydroxy-tetrahydrodipicolinate synthase